MDCCAEPSTLRALRAPENHFPSGSRPSQSLRAGDLPHHRRQVRAPAVRWEPGAALDDVAEVLGRQGGGEKPEPPRSRASRIVEQVAALITLMTRAQMRITMRHVHALLSCMVGRGGGVGDRQRHTADALQSAIDAPPPLRPTAGVRGGARSGRSARLDLAHRTEAVMRRVNVDDLRLRGHEVGRGV